LDGFDGGVFSGHNFGCLVGLDWVKTHVNRLEQWLVRNRTRRCSCITTARWIHFDAEKRAHNRRALFRLPEYQEARPLINLLSLFGSIQTAVTLHWKPCIVALTAWK
jgi:hypothetical protein